MRGQLRIDQLYAFIVLDDDGTEGVPAMLARNGMMIPMMGADMTRVDQLRTYLQNDPLVKGKKITLAVFSQRENLEVIDRTSE